MAINRRPIPIFVTTSLSLNIIRVSEFATYSYCNKLYRLAIKTDGVQTRAPHLPRGSLALLVKYLDLGVPGTGFNIMPKLI